MQVNVQAVNPCPTAPLILPELQKTKRSPSVVLHDTPTVAEIRRSAKSSTNCYDVLNLITISLEVDMKLIAFILSLFLFGCASTSVTVQYQSDPPGATILENGKPFGVTPVAVSYAAEPSFRSGGCQNVRGTTAIWPSGAKAEISQLQLCANVGWNQSFWFTRPDVAGREIDMNYSLQKQRNDIMAEQARQAQQRAAIQTLGDGQQFNALDVFKNINRSCPMTWCKSTARTG